MTRIRVAAASLNQTPLDWDGNREILLSAIAEAREVGASLLCTPELSLSGYGCEDAFLWPATREMALTVLSEILPHTRGLVVSLGLPLEVQGEVFNGAALLVDGHLLGIALKQHLAGAGLHYEPRWFRPWPAGTASEIDFLGKLVPVGDLLFEVGGLRMGFEICEDAWMSPRVGPSLSSRGAQLIFAPSASHFSFRKFKQRRKLALSLVEDYGVAYVACNLLGNEAGRAIYDGDALIVAAGDQGPQLLAATKRFSFAPKSLACATLSFEIASTRAGPSSSAHEQQMAGLVSCDFLYPTDPRGDRVSGQTTGANEEGELEKETALARVIALGLFDYLRKSHSRAFVVSLSGGADSAAVATLVRLMLSLGVKELGLEPFFKRAMGLSKADTAHTPESLSELAKKMLLTVYQATENSSETTRKAASTVAQALGAEHFEIEVDALVETYRGLAEGMMARPLTWETDDIALQNIQARVRAPSVWMLANLRGALLLSTSNRSEAAVGYATMDGDTAGGLCPIGGVDKAFLRKWLVFMERQGLPEIGPLPALELVNRQKPTAELRPASSGQTDEDDLMPYELLDVIERAVIVEHLAPSQVLKKLEGRFDKWSRPQLLTWLRRFYRLFAANQWKRERYAPSFHVDDINLDPKTWCRFPILSGAFRRELAELD